MFDFYYGNEAEQFTFLRVPKFLFSDEAFISLSSDAKILYSLMLDRMGLSVKNSWIDEENRVYIFYTLEEAQANMNCGHDKCTKIFAELENIGLIVRKKRGMGRPSLIYVKNFVRETEETADIPEDEEMPANPLPDKTAENPQSRLPKNRSQDCGKAEVMTAEKPQSRVRKSRSQDCGKTAVIKNNNIKTEFSETQSNQSLAHTRDGEIDRTERKKIIKANISYDILLECYSTCTELIEEITDIITDVADGRRRVYISGQAVPQTVAAERFMLLRFEHVQYVIDSISVLKKGIAKPDAYICAALYNATYTLNISTFAGFTAQTGISLRSVN